MCLEIDEQLVVNEDLYLCNVLKIASHVLKQCSIVTISLS